MYVVARVLFILLLSFFVYDTHKYFLKVYRYNKESGYRDQTICYIRSPYMNLFEHSKIVFNMSKWAVKSVSICLWCYSLYLVMAKVNLLGGMITAYGAYIIVFVWYQSYATINGAKILNSGIVNGLEKINWEQIEEFKYSNKSPRISNKQALKIKCTGRIFPLYIFITTENKELVRRLIDEKCVA